MKVFNGILLKGESKKLINEIKEHYYNIIEKFNISNIGFNNSDIKLKEYIDEILFKSNLSEEIPFDLKTKISDFFIDYEKEQDEMRKKIIQTHKYIIYILFEYFLKLNIKDKYKNLHELFYIIDPKEKNNMLEYLYGMLIYRVKNGGNSKKCLKKY